MRMLSEYFRKIFIFEKFLFFKNFSKDFFKNFLKKFVWFFPSKRLKLASCMSHYHNHPYFLYIFLLPIDI